VHQWFAEMEADLAEEVARRVESDEEMPDRGTVWTYLTTDQPFQTWQRYMARMGPFAYVAYLGMGA
jgi:hypothetical protein